MSARLVRSAPMIILLAAAASGCFSTKGGRAKGNYCTVKKSGNWSAIITNWQMPTELSQCPYKLNSSTTRTIIGNATFWFNSGANSDTAPRSHHYYYWTKQTRDTITNALRSPFAQDSGYWIQQGQHMNGSDIVYEMRLPLSVVIGLPPESDSLLQLDSLYANFLPMQSVSGSFFSADSGIGMFVSTVKRGVTKSGSINGPGGLIAGTGSLWSHVPVNDDTLGFRYQWYINGSELTGANGSSLSTSFGTAGTYTLRLDQGLVDTTYSFTKTVTVEIAVTVTGQSVLTPFQYYTWNASPSGGVGSYAYEWYLDASYVQNGSSFGSAFNANESHWLDVKVTDGNGNVGWGTHQFYTTNEGGGEVELRLDLDQRDPGAWRTRRLPPGRPRRPH